MAKLLRESVSIRNMPVIFETLADFAKLTNDTDVLGEYVRQALASQITKSYVKDDNLLKVITVSGKVEKAIADHIQQTEHGNYLSLDPDQQQAIIQAIHKEAEKVSLQEETTIIICSPAVRMYLKQLLDRFLPQVVVLSYNELEPTVEVQSVGVVNIA